MRTYFLIWAEDNRHEGIKAYESISDFGADPRYPVYPSNSFNYGIDADLSNLSISGGTFDKAFAAGITSYTASVDNSVTSITVTPTLRDTKAVVSVNSMNIWQVTAIQLNI